MVIIAHFHHKFDDPGPVADVDCNLTDFDPKLVVALDNVCLWYYCLLDNVYQALLEKVFCLVVLLTCETNCIIFHLQVPNWNP